ncbi:MAG: acetate kinase [Oscillospiraceae bacterium]|nr:acetate kinase [Oscillospiraceae bacterium]MDD3832695.1 acetate kinase [Oscillospiraceae bacterium]MDD4546180.1 acetate kinase [Oscillospiraceae bacterium]
MNILVINAGSSSLKYQLINMNGEIVLAKGNCERIGIGGKFTHKTHDGRVLSKEVEMQDHTAAFAVVKNALLSGEGKVINDLSEVAAIGHRIVQGGYKYDRSVLVTQQVIDDIDDLAELAPLHNKAHVQGINAATAAFGKEVPQVVVFDTAFHQTMPPKAYMFGVPYEYYEKYKIRRYGFHGTSHRYVSARCLELIGNPEGKDTRIISCHLGNGSSIAALKDGKVIDTTMGLTPLDGFMMGTRSGGIDPSVVSFIMDKEGFNPKEMDDVLNKKSGMLGISGVSSDDRDIAQAIEDGNQRAKLAWDMRTYEIIKYIGGYIAALGGIDAIIFTAGIGENQSFLRQEILESLGYRGVKVDMDKNNVRGQEAEITTPDSTVRGFVIPTNEELVIARDTMNIISGN